MPTISGRVIFDRDRSATINAGDSGLANVPVVLQNIATNFRLVVLTDANGNYSFINVPNGDYRIVEAYGTTGGVATPGDFNNAILGPFPIGMNPPLSFATNPPTGTTNLDSVTPDTILVTVAGIDLANENFLDGPVIYTSIGTILDQCAVISDENLITAASNGTFGFFQEGTPANTGAPVEPYPGVTPDFTYVLPDPTKYTPNDGEYTVQNIMNNAFSNNIGAWWRISDHTTGNETGRMMVVNGFNPGAVFFREVVLVEPNTNYLFSSWILNLFKVTGYPNPALGVRILDENNNILYSATLGNQIPVNTNAPEWKEIGTVINSRDNTNITVEFLSEGPAAIGNDYAIDDISLREIEVPQFIPEKSVSDSNAEVGQVVTYTINLENTCNSPLTDVFFQDIVPEGLEFLPGTVTVNGNLEANANPNNGFNIPNILGGNTATITFDAIVTNVPNINPTLNTATMTYSYTPVEGGIPSINTVDSNTVSVEINESADISVIKTGNPNPVDRGEMLNFTMEVSNSGPSNAENVILSDIVPPSITGVEFSIDGGLTWNPWTGSYIIGTLANGSSRTILIRGIVSSTATGTITNTATVASTTPDPNPDNNTSTVIIEVSAISADVSVVKTSNPNPVIPGETLTYTILVSNAGPSSAENVVLSDIIPSSIIGAEFSVDGGLTWNPWTSSYNIGTLQNGSSRTILIRGTVSPTATGTITNTARVASTTPDPNPDNNTSTTNTEVTSSLSADISVIKTSSPNPISIEEILTYTIVVSNSGPSSAQNVIVNDNISPSISLAEFSVDGGLTWNPWIGSYNIGILPNGSSRTILIRGRVNSTATKCIANSAYVTSTTPDPNPTNNISTICTEVISECTDLSITKKGFISCKRFENIVTYKIKISNLGMIDANNVVLEDNIPEDILNVRFSNDGGRTWLPWMGSYNIGTLRAGVCIIIIIQGVLSERFGRKLVNTAKVTSTTCDPDLSNNTSTSIIRLIECNDCDNSCGRR